MPETTRSLGLMCPLCMDAEQGITLDLDDLDECYCKNCDGTFSLAKTAATFAEQAAKWAAVAEWVKTAPAE